jgi:hypothetical protein
MDQSDQIRLCVTVSVVERSYNLHGGVYIYCCGRLTPSYDLANEEPCKQKWV